MALFEIANTDQIESLTKQFLASLAFNDVHQDNQAHQWMWMKQGIITLLRLNIPFKETQYATFVKKFLKHSTQSTMATKCQTNWEKVQEVHSTNYLLVCTQPYWNFLLWVSVESGRACRTEPGMRGLTTKKMETVSAAWISTLWNNLAISVGAFFMQCSCSLKLNGCVPILKRLPFSVSFHSWPLIGNLFILSPINIKCWGKATE